MRCAKYRHYIDLLPDGNLDKAAAQRLDAHLKDCVSCRVYHDQGLRLQQLIQSAPQAPFPDWLHQRILHDFRAHEVQRSGFRKRARWQLVPAAMAVMLSLFLGSLIGKTAFDTQTQTAASSSQTSDELSFGDITLVDSDYYSGGANE